MNPDVIEDAAQAGYQAYSQRIGLKLTWDQLNEQEKETGRLIARAVLKAAGVLTD